MNDWWSSWLDQKNRPILSSAMNIANKTLNSNDDDEDDDGSLILNILGCFWFIITLSPEYAVGPSLITPAIWLIILGMSFDKISCRLLSNSLSIIIAVLVIA